MGQRKSGNAQDANQILPELPRKKLIRSGALREKMGWGETGEERAEGAGSGCMCKIVWNNGPQKGERRDYLECRRRKLKKSDYDLDSGRNMFGGAEFGGGSRSSCLGKSSTIDFPLFDHVTPLGIKRLLFFWGGGKVAQLDNVPLASET